MPIATIIIPTKDRPDILRQSLQFLQRAIYGKDIEVIVVNDGHALPDMTTFPFVCLIQNKGSGVASARNLGASQSHAERLLFLDDDMLVFPENIGRILDLTRDIPDKCINLNWVYPPEVERQLSGYAFGRYLIRFGFTTLKGWNRGNSWNDRELFETTGITSQLLYISKQAFNRAGGYTESFPFAGFEDYDLAQKLRQQHIKFYIDPLSTCWHNELDRLTPENWLERKRRGALTRRHAVLAGHTELSLQYSIMKRNVYALLILFKPFIFWVLKQIPNRKSFDFLYFRCINILLGAVTYEGFRNN